MFYTYRHNIVYNRSSLLYFYKYERQTYDLKQFAVDSITYGEIKDLKKWNMWCSRLKSSAKQNKYPYPVEFTNDIIFDMMKLGCFYCQDIATEIDRIDSNLGHIPENCVGCCHGCNISKGVSDSSTFIRKAYFRARREYVDDVNNIWFVNDKKPSLWDYKNSARRVNVLFDLTVGEFEKLIRDDCKYCRRTPDKWFGIDRVIPSLGYVLDNVVTCCWDCNVDKLDGDVASMIARNDRIASRVTAGELVIKEYEKVILHKRGNKTSKKVCAYGTVYKSKSEASRSLGKNYTYVRICIRRCQFIDDIFEVNDDFYEYCQQNNIVNITKKMYILFNRM